MRIKFIDNLVLEATGMRKSSILPMDVTITAETRMTEISFSVRDEYDLIVTSGVKFVATRAELDTAKMVATNAIIRDVYSEVIDVINRSLFHIQYVDMERGVAELEELLSALSPRS